MADTAKVPTILAKIYGQRMKDVEIAKSTPGMRPEEIDACLEMQLPPLSFSDFYSTFCPEKALFYANSGASVISILTESPWFKGSLVDVRLVCQAVDALLNRIYLRIT